MTKFLQLEEVLEEGKHRIKVYPKNEWDEDEKKFKKDTHKSGVSKTGNQYWLYQTKVGEQYIGMIAFDEEQKRIYDQIDVEANVVHKIDRATKEPIWKVIDEKPVKVLKVYINEIKETKETKEPLPQEPQEEVKVDDLPF